MAHSPDTPRTAPVDGVVDLNGVVEGMRPLLSRVAGSFIQFEMRLDPVAPKACAERDQVEQALLSLVVSACDAMPLGGKLAVSTHCWRLPRPHQHPSGIVPAGRWALLRVSDTGARLEAEMRTQLAGLPPESIGGIPAAGADLTRAASVVRRASGHVIVADGSESGTVVTLCFPLKEGSSGVVPPPVNTPGILVVDGDVWMQTTTAHLLRRAGYGVLQTDHARGALELLRGVTGSCVRVMLIDVDLPGDDAVALAKAARRLRADLKVILVGRTRAGSSEDLLIRPFTPDELLQAVADRLGAPSAS